MFYFNVSCIQTTAVFIVHVTFLFDGSVFVEKRSYNIPTIPQEPSRLHLDNICVDQHRNKGDL